MDLSWGPPVPNHRTGFPGSDFQRNQRADPGGGRKTSGRGAGLCRRRSNAIGAFYHFIEEKDVRLIGCEAAGRGIHTKETAATIATGKPGIFHGMKSYFCQDEYGQIAPVYSISAGLDYPGIGPEHADLYDKKRAEYVAVTDDEAVDAFEYLSRTEGIIPAIESAHAVAYAMKLAKEMRPDQCIVVNLSGRGDKDCAAIARYRGEDIYE